MKISNNLLKDHRDEWLVTTTAMINTVNPIIDRIMDDDSVEGVVMTNKEGAPILTNISLTSATNFGLELKLIGTLAQTYSKELDPFDEVLVVRINTKKIEMMLAPHSEFNIIVVQHARHKMKNLKNKRNKII
ncbi:dynein light chain roadblock-type 1 [Aphomia sociella]